MVKTKNSGKFNSRPEREAWRRETKIITVLLIIVILSQIGFSYFAFNRLDYLAQSIVDSEKRLDEKIDLNDNEIRGNINTISSSLSNVASVQSDFQDELSEIKATASSDFSGIIEQEIRGVVTIKTDISQGSGFLISDDGYVITNHHVIEGAKNAAVYTFDGNSYAVARVGYNEVMDLALLKIEGSFDKLDIGDSDDVRVGEKVLAMGNPLGLSFTATEGIISAKDREGINGLPYYFQTDVSLNPGNSGGPLINTKGKVIGVNNFKVSGAEGIGFALEIKYAVEVVNELSVKAFNQTII